MKYEVFRQSQTSFLSGGTPSANVSIIHPCLLRPYGHAWEGRKGYLSLDWLHVALGIPPLPLGGCCMPCFHENLVKIDMDFPKSASHLGAYDHTPHDPNRNI
jgi:hypothetical protein